MEIYYDQRSDGAGNFGDDLNPWLWQQLLPELLTRQDGVVLVGIGTLLNAKLLKRVKKAQRVSIFSTGVGYEQPLTTLPDHWKIYCLRGPLSCQALGISSELAITDGAVLLRRLIKPTLTQPNKAAFMPHIHHAVFAGDRWRQICQLSGIHYINPQLPVEQVLSAIQQSRVLITEAMHGAIVADALGVPWIPVVTSPRILQFKWQDWCASVQQPYRPIYLPPLTTGYPRYGRGVRSIQQAAKHWGKALLQRAWQPALTRQPEQLAAALNRIVEGVPSRLSDRAHLENLTQALEGKLEELRYDLSSLN
ncbi:MAG: polysaccharide pyruvyl transferase family protein [Cyanobacteria bacterium P01_H01_bin.58]